MVLSLCERLLGDTQDAEDAFQATFLVLVRKAGSIRNPDALGSWLFGIASGWPCRPGSGPGRAAGRSNVWWIVARSDAGLRSWLIPQIRNQPGPNSTRRWTVYRSRSGLRSLLHYFQGLSTETIAQRLGCRRGTVLSRLARARSRLKNSSNSAGSSRLPPWPCWRRASTARRSGPRATPACHDAGRGQPGTRWSHAQERGLLDGCLAGCSNTERTHLVPGTQDLDDSCDPRVGWTCLWFLVRSASAGHSGEVATFREQTQPILGHLNRGRIPDSDGTATRVRWRRTSDPAAL